MTKKSTLTMIPEETLRYIDHIKNSANLKHRTDAFKLTNGITPQIEKIETKRLPRSKKRQVVVFGKWVFEL